MAVSKEEFKEIADKLQAICEREKHVAIYLMIEDGESVHRMVAGPLYTLIANLAIDAQAVAAAASTLNGAKHGIEEALGIAGAGLPGPERLGGADGEREQGAGGDDPAAP